MAMVRINVLGLDPGKTNFGWAASKVTINNNNGSVSIKQLGYGKIQNTVRDLTVDVKEQIKAFSMELDGLLRQYEVNLVVAERFQSRGFKGNTIEYVNSMLGVVVSLLLRYEEERNLNTYYFSILASTWKNEAKRQGLLLENLYKDYSFIMSPHEIDASVISWFGAMKEFSDLLPLSGVSSSVNTILMSCETTKSKVGNAIM